MVYRGLYYKAVYNYLQIYSLTIPHLIIPVIRNYITHTKRVNANE